MFDLISASHADTSALAITATEKILEGDGNIDRYLMLAFAAVSWWFVRKNLELVQKNKDEITAINAFYTKKLEDLNTAHDAQLERMNNANLVNIEKIMDKFSSERTSWTQTQKEFTASIMELSRAIEKRKKPLEFHDE